MFPQWELGLRVAYFHFGDSFEPLFLSECDLPAIIIGDNNFVEVVVNLHDWAASLNAAELDTRDVFAVSSIIN